jgi:hypothetical protein
MALERSIIREDLRALLDGATDAGSSVFKSRSEPFAEDDLPAIAIVTPSEDGDNLAADGGHPQLRKTLTVVIRCMVAATSDASMSIALDTLTEQVEPLILTNIDFIKAREKLLDFNTALATTEDGAVIPGVADITMRLQYTEEYPPVIGDDLKTIAADWDMASPRNDPQTPTGPDGQIDAQDELKNLET